MLDRHHERVCGLLYGGLQFWVGEGRVNGFGDAVYGSVDGGGEGLPVLEGEGKSGTLVGGFYKCAEVWVGGLHVLSGGRGLGVVLGGVRGGLVADRSTSGWVGGGGAVGGEAWLESGRRWNGEGHQRGNGVVRRWCGAVGVGVRVGPIG